MGQAPLETPVLRTAVFVQLTQWSDLTSGMGLEDCLVLCGPAGGETGLFRALTGGIYPIIEVRRRLTSQMGSPTTL